MNKLSQEHISQIAERHGFRCKFLNPLTIYIETPDKVYEYYCEIHEDHLRLMHKNSQWNSKYHIQGRYTNFYHMFEYLQTHDTWKLRPHRPKGVARVFYMLENNLIPKIQMI